MNRITKIGTVSIPKDMRDLFSGIGKYKRKGIGMKSLPPRIKKFIELLVKAEIYTYPTIIKIIKDKFNIELKPAEISRLKGELECAK